MQSTCRGFQAELWISGGQSPSKGIWSVGKEHYSLCGSQTWSQTPEMPRSQECLWAWALRDGLPTAVTLECESSRMSRSLGRTILQARARLLWQTGTGYSAYLINFLSTSFCLFLCSAALLMSLWWQGSFLFKDWDKVSFVPDFFFLIWKFYCLKRKETLYIINEVCTLLNKTKFCMQK